MIWSVNSGSTGIDRHVALLKAHQAPVDEPGYPLARFLDSYISDGGTSVAPSVQAVGAPQPMSALHAAASQADGSLHLALTGPGGSPLTDGVAALVNADGHVVSYGKTDATGNVTLSAVPGQYQVVAC